MAELCPLRSVRIVRVLIALAGVAPIAMLMSPSAIAQDAAAQAPRSRAGCPADATARFYPCALEKAKAYNPPRTSDGKPDLQGIWRRSVMNISVEDFAGDTFSRVQKSVIVEPADGKVPYQPWAAARQKEHYDKYLDGNALCLMAGIPRMFLISPINQIVQTPNYIVMSGEEAHLFRVIPLDARPHVGAKIRLWMGSSRGRWDGNTLVVDVTNQNGKNWLDVLGNFASDAVHVVERLTFVDRDTLLYEATVRDPHVFTRPWKIATFLTRETEPGFELFEEACHEGESFGTKQLPAGTRKLYPGMTAENVK